MLKNVFPALAALLLVVSSARADDSMEFDLSQIQDAEISIQEVDFDIDVDALEAETDDLMAGSGDELDEAIGACFRNFGYGGFVGGFGGGYGGFYGCYRPIYRSFCYHSYYRPIVHCCRPIYSSYWGCW